MNTTQKPTQERILNENNMLIRPDGTYNERVHSTLSDIIFNMASKCHRTNETIGIDDLYQEAWLKVIDTINKGKEKNQYYEIPYLVITAKNAILAACINNNKNTDNIDNFSSALMSSSEASKNHGYSTTLNVAKAKMEYDISRHRINESEASIIRIALEQILKNCSPNDERVKTLIVIKYVKEFNGDSEIINQMYTDFYNSIDDERKSILDEMDNTKFTHNDAFKAMGLRATDNCSTQIRKRMKELLSILRD